MGLFTPKIREFKTETWIPAPLPKVFEFFSNAGNLEALTPPWVSFHIITPQPIAMHPGALIDYRLRIRGLPVNWRTRITTWNPPHRFVDEQLRGPYRVWEHEHTFEEKNGGTFMRDNVRYAVPFDFLVHALFVRRDVERIFEYRREALLKTAW
jgi:ligand-binding SRPBCC domain-containing protein